MGQYAPIYFFYTKGKFRISVSDEADKAEGELTAEQEDTINKVLDYYGHHDAQWLSQLTRMEDPWNNTRKDVVLSESCNNIISKADMAEYYGGLE